MHIRNKLLSGFLLILIIAIAVSGVSYQRLQEVVRPLQKDIPESIENLRMFNYLDRRVQMMRYYIEVLFSCTQNYVASQNIWWKQRYFAFKEPMDKTIQDVVNYNSKDSREIFLRIQEAYTHLTSMQIKIIKTVDDREFLKAEELLKKKEYWERKGQLENFIDTYFSEKEAQYEQAFESPVVLVKIAAQKSRIILRNSLSLILLWSVIAVILSISLGFFITDTIAGPLEKLTVFTKNIGRGDFSKKLKITSKDEVGVLANAFNKMLKDLDDYREKLIRNEKLAAMGKLAGIIGHEIRNPLASIANSVYFLKMKLERNKDEKIVKHLRIMQEEVVNAETVIEDTLEFAREKEPMLEQADIIEVVNQAIKRKAIPENIKLNKDFAKDIALLGLDISQMVRVFYNLIWNAIQAMPEGGDLTVRVKSDKKMAVVSIIDSGGGIPKENLTKLFEPLFTTKTKGTGLGLSVCQSIVKSHRGEIEVKSDVGKGTAFIVYLPIVKEV